MTAAKFGSFFMKIRSTKFKKKKIKINDRLELYKLSHALVIHEAQAQWNVSALFVLANSVLAGFIGTNLLQTNKPQPEILTLKILVGIGLTLTILWFFSNLRTSNWYRFRMAQAKQREPDGWMLFNDDAENESKGDTIIIKEEEYNLSRFFCHNLCFNISNLTIVTLMCIIFIVFYLYLFAHLGLLK